ncbi:MAG: fumarylacetoacetase [Saprospiraceae bacterium]|nr:fumarylacetoacetase [Saprospiraceae bacterium]
MNNPNDPEITSWLPVGPDSDFPIQNIPFGIVKTKNGGPRVASRIGNFAIDLLRVSELGFFSDFDIPKKVFDNLYLNDFISLGQETTRNIRARISELFSEQSKKWNSREMSAHIAIPIDEVEVLLPVRVGDYTDFYSSIEHATNVGSLFRDPENALLPNWRHLPVGYHGRASSIVVSGTDIIRPAGQTMPAGADKPQYSPTKLLDFELEIGFVVGKENGLGHPVPVSQAEDYIFGLCLFNDWSARDIQKWEYVPLGPFLGKNFASTVSPWIVTLDALATFRVEGPVQEPEVLPYLKTNGKHNFDIHLEVEIETLNGHVQSVCQSNFKYMYWNMAQQIAHHTVNGCNLRVGDMGASGTISGPKPGSFGSMLEISWRGTKPVDMPDGSQRKFINDGDSVVLKGFAKSGDLRIGFGEARGKILPALTNNLS